MGLKRGSHVVMEEKNSEGHPTLVAFEHCHVSTLESPTSIVGSHVHAHGVSARNALHSIPPGVKNDQNCRRTAVVDVLHSS